MFSIDAIVPSVDVNLTIKKRERVAARSQGFVSPPPEEEGIF